MTAQARQITRPGVPPRLSNQFAPESYPANAPAYVSGAVVAGIGPSSQEKKPNAPSTGGELTFSLSSGAASEGFSITGTTVYYANPANPGSSPVAVAKISPKGTLSTTGHAVATPVYGSVSGKNTYLGTVNYVPVVTGSDISFAYSGFRGAYVSETTREYIPDYSIGAYVPVGITINGTTSFNPASGHVHVNFPGFYGPGTSPLPPSEMFLTPQIASGPTFGLPKGIGVAFNVKTTPTPSGYSTTVQPVGLTVSGAPNSKVSPTVGITTATPAGSATTIYTLSGSGITATTSTETKESVFATASGAVGLTIGGTTTFLSPSTAVGQHFLSLLGPSTTKPASSGVPSGRWYLNSSPTANLHASNEHGLIGGEVIPANGIYIPQGGNSQPLSALRFQNVVSLNGKTYPVNYGNGLVLGSSSSFETLPGSRPKTSYPTSRTSSYTSSVTLETGSIQLSLPGIPARSKAQSYLSLSTSTSKILSPVSGTATINPGPNQEMTSIGFFEAEGYTASAARQMVSLQEVQSFTSSVETALNSTIGLMPLPFYETAAAGAQSMRSGQNALYSNASAETKAAGVLQIVTPSAIGVVEGFGLGATGEAIYNPMVLVSRGAVVAGAVGYGVLNGQTSPKQIAANAAEAVTFLGGTFLLEAAVAPVSAALGEAIGAKAAATVTQIFSYGSVGVITNEASSVIQNSRGITALGEAETFVGTALAVVGGSVVSDQLFGVAPTGATIESVSRSGMYQETGGQQAGIQLARPVGLISQVETAGGQQVTFVPEPDSSFAVSTKNAQVMFGSINTAQYAIAPGADTNLQVAYRSVLTAIEVQRTGNPFVFLRSIAPEELYSEAVLEGKPMNYVNSGEALGTTNLGTPAKITFSSVQPVILTGEGLVSAEAPVTGQATVTLTSPFRQFLYETFGVDLPTKTVEFTSTAPKSLTTSMAGTQGQQTVSTILGGENVAYTQDTYAGSAVSKIDIQNSDYTLLSGKMTEGARTIYLNDVLLEPQTPPETPNATPFRETMSGSTTSSGNTEVPSGKGMSTLQATSLKMAPASFTEISITPDSLTSLSAPPDPSVIVTQQEPHAATTTQQASLGPTGMFTLQASGRAAVSRGSASRTAFLSPTLEDFSAFSQQTPAPVVTSKTSGLSYSTATSPATTTSATSLAQSGDFRQANAGAFQAPRIVGLEQGALLVSGVAFTESKKQSESQKVPQSSAFGFSTGFGYKSAIEQGYKPAIEQGYKSAIEQGYKPAIEQGYKPAQSEKSIQKTSQNQAQPPGPGIFSFNLPGVGTTVGFPGGRKRPSRSSGKAQRGFMPKFRYNVDLTSQTFNIHGARGTKKQYEAFGLARPYF